MAAKAAIHDKFEQERNDAAEWNASPQLVWCLLMSWMAASAAMTNCWLML
jgi:hypothetical protein